MTAPVPARPRTPLENPVRNILIIVLVVLVVLAVLSFLRRR